MDELAELTAFAQNLQQDVFARADAVEDGALRAIAFTEIVLGYLSDTGEIDDGIPSAYEAKGMRCSGYFLSEDNDRLDLFLSIPRLDGVPGPISKGEIDAAFRHLMAFLKKALDGGHKGLEEASEGYDMAPSNWLARSEISHVRLFVLTDSLVKIDHIANEFLGD